MARLAALFCITLCWFLSWLWWNACGYLRYIAMLVETAEALCSAKAIEDSTTRRLRRQSVQLLVTAMLGHDIALISAILAAHTLRMSIYNRQLV